MCPICGNMKKLPKVLSDNEIAKLYKFFHKYRHSKTNTRDLCIVVFMLEYGLRVQEVCDLDRSDIDMVTGKLHVTGKGKRDRILFVQPRHLKLVENWLLIRPVGPFLFSTIHQSRGKIGKQLDQRQIRAKLKRIGKKIGRPDLHPHLLRHTFGTRMYNFTRDLVRTQEILGHQSPNTTRIYTHISGADVQDTLQQFHA